MNSESVQCLVLDTGVQELRAVLHYQLMQKQLLLVTVKANSMMMKKHRRAQAEIDLFHEYRIKVSNPILDYDKLYKPGHAPGVVVVCQDSVEAAKSKIAHQTASYAEHLFIPLMPIKEALRGRIEKKQKEMLVQLSQVQVIVNEASGKDAQIYASLNTQTIGKLNKDYRIALVHCYCTQICKLNLLNALRVSTIEQSSRLSLLMNIFPPSQTILYIQANEPKDYLQFHSHFANASEKAILDRQIFEQFEQGELSSLSLIPSTRSLFQMEPLTYDDKPVFEKSIFDQVSGLEFNLKHLKGNKLEKYSSREHLRGLLQSLDSYQAAGLEQALSNTQISRVYKFQHSLREIFEHKFFYAKLSMRPVEALQLEAAAFAGESYWAMGDEEEGEMMMRLIGEDKKLSDLILKKLVDERRRKQQLQDELAEFGKEFRLLLQAAESHAPTLGIARINQYLERYREYLHLKLIGGLFNTIESFFAKKRSVQCIQSLFTSLNTLTRIELDVPFFENNFLTLHNFTLDSTHRSLDSQVKHDFKTFNRSVQGLKLEKEIVEASYLLVSDIFAYPSNCLHQSNYCGQSYLFSQHQGLSSLLFGLDTEESSYLSTIYSQLEQNSRDYTILDTTCFLKSDLSSEGLNKKVAYASDLATSKVLYFSLIILLNSRSIPHDAHTFHAVMLPIYKRQIGWKVENEYQKKLGASMIKYKKQSKEIAPQQQVFDPKINRAAMSQIEASMQKEFHDRGASNTTEVAPQLAQREPDKEIQFQQIKQGRMMMKAVIKVSQREVDGRLIKMGYEACSKQVSALSKTLEMASARLDNSIGNWQQFAATLSDYNPKRQQHLDPLNKISFLQLFLTRMKNRGMEIETLTSGPGVVFTYKDLNECLQTLCTQIMSQSEKEMRTRTQSLSEQINHLMNLTYIKDCRIESLKQKVVMMQDNIARSVNSKIYEKGNALIFELDRGLREVRFYKEHIHSFEKEMMEIVRVDFRKSLMDKDLQIDSSKKEAYDNLNKLIADFKLLSSRQEVESLDKIKAVQKWAKFEDESYLHAKSPGMMGPAKTSVKTQQQQTQLQEATTGVSEEGEERMRQQLIKTQEDNIRLQKLIKQQRSLWMLKSQTIKLKYEDEFEILKKKLTSNQALWEQLEESDKRTKILQQELIFTQKSLTQCEKIIDKLKEELKMSEHERIRLAQYRQNKGQRLQELEEQVKKMDVSDHININKVVEQLRTKDKQLLYLQNIEKSHNAQMQKTYEIQAKKDQVWRKKLDQEVDLKRQALLKLNELQEEIKAVNVGGQSDLVGNDQAPNWKLKCKELYDICNCLAEENQSLLIRIKDLQNPSQIQSSSSDNLIPLRSDLNRNITQNTPSGLRNKSTIGKTRNHRKEELLPLTAVNFGDDQSLDNSRDHNMFLNPSSSLYSQGFLLPKIKASRLANLSLVEHHQQETSGALSQPNRSKSQLEPKNQSRGNAASQNDIHQDDSLVGQFSKNSEFLDLSLNHVGEISLGNSRLANQEAMIQQQAYQAQSPLMIPIQPIMPIPVYEYRGRSASKQYGLSVTKSTSQGDLFAPNPSQPTIPSTASNLDAYGLGSHALHSRAKIHQLHPQAYSSNIQSSERLPLASAGGRTAQGKSPMVMMMRQLSNQRQLQQQYQDSIRTEQAAAVGHSNMMHSTFHYNQRRDSERPLKDNQEQSIDPYSQSEQQSGLRLKGSRIVTNKKKLS